MSILDDILGVFGKKKAATPAVPTDVFQPSNQPATTFKLNPEGQKKAAAQAPVSIFTPPVQQTPKYQSDVIRAPKAGEAAPALTPTQEAMKKSQMDINPLVEKQVMMKRDSRALKGIVDDKVFAEGDTDEMIEEAKNKYLTLRYIASTDRGTVHQGFRQAGASALDTIDLFASPVTGRGGTSFTPENQMMNIERFLQQYAPDELAEVKGMEVADEAVLARQIGGISSEVVQSLLPGGIAIKAVRALPLLAQLRNAGRTGILAANVIENVAASLAVNAQFNAKSGGDMEDYVKTVIANPSALLPFARKSELIIGLGVDYMAAKALGMSEMESWMNAAGGLAGNTMQRRGVKSEIEGFTQMQKLAREEIDRLYAMAPQYANDPKGMQKLWDGSIKSLQQRGKVLMTDSGITKETGRKGIERPSRPDVFTPPDAESKWASEYAQEQTAARESARKAEKGTMGQRMSDFYRNTLRPIITDTAAPLEDTLKRTGIQSEQKPKVVTNQIDRVLNNNQIAHQFMEDKGLNAVIRDVPKEDYDGLSQYLTAKQATKVAERGKLTGRDIEADRRYVEATKERYEPEAAKVRQYQRSLLDQMVEYKLISPELRKTLIEENPDYVPLKRIFDDLEITDKNIGGYPKKRPLGSLSKQTVVQKLEGSTREIEDPLYALQQMTELMTAQGERNRLFHTIKDLKDVEGNPLGIEVLRDADKVQERIDLFSEAKELRPLQDKARKFIQTRSKWLKKLQTEMNNLQKKSVTESTRPTKTQPKEKLSSGVEVKTKNGKVTKENLIPATGKPRDAKAFIEELMRLPKSKVEQLKKSVELRDEKSKKLFSELEDLRSEYESIQSRRAEIFDEAKLVRDADADGRATVSGMKNGIKEIITLDPQYAKVLNDMNPEQLDWFAKTNRFFARMLKLGATGINLPFAVRNIIKDQFAGSINNEFAARAAIGLPQAMYEAVGHGKMYKEMLRNGALFTEFDTYRKPQKASIAETRSHKNIKERFKYVATHPNVWLRTIEDIIGRSEQIGRLQQFTSNLEGRKAQGFSPEDASIFASTAARENTGNFRRVMAGNKVLSYLSPYFNAAKEGTRSRLRAWKRDPAGTALKSGMEIVMPTVALTLWNLSSPEKEEAYRDLQNSHKDNNMVFIPDNPEKGEDGLWTTFNVPLQGQDAALATLTRKAVEAMHGADPVTTGDLFSAMVGMTSPFDPGSSGFGVSTLVPQAIKPMLEATSNKDLFRNRDIVPFYMQDEPIEDQRQPWTSETATRLGVMMGVAPAKVEHVLRGYFANNATTALHWGDVLLAAAGAIEKEDVKGTGIMKGIFNSLLRAPGNQSDASNPLDEDEPGIFDIPIIGGDGEDVFSDTSDRAF